MSASPVSPSSESPELKTAEIQSPDYVKTAETQSPNYVKTAEIKSPDHVESEDSGVHQGARSPLPDIYQISKEGEHEAHEGAEEEEEEEEEGECGFCLFMKGGGCKESFIAWSECVEEGERNKEDIVEKCFEVTAKLKHCMDAHADYYEPILRAEKSVQEESAHDSQREEHHSVEEEANKDSYTEPA